jgi:hypothetical protein
VQTDEVTFGQWKDVPQIGLCSVVSTRNFFALIGREPQWNIAYPCQTWIEGIEDKVYKACSKKDRTFVIKTLFYIILSTVPFKVVPSTGDTPFPMFLPLLECFLERTFCDGAQFSYHIFLNLRVFKKRPNFLKSSPTSIEGTLRLLSAPSGRF